MSDTTNRRRFLKVAAATTVAAPAIFTSKRTMAQDVIGEGDHKFHCEHFFPRLPDQFHWQITHNVAIDPDNNLYVIHEGNKKLTDHPSIFVFDSEGTFIRAFGQQFQGGGHGIEIRVEDGTPYLYVAAYQQVKSIAKLTLDGELVWQEYAPMKSGLYAAGEASDPDQVWGRDRFMPTNFAFLPNGDFLLADGYGAWAIHRYTRDGKWLSHFGGAGDGKGKFALPHGIWLDDRIDGAAEIVVADRAHNTLQTFALDGTYKKTVTGFGLPANIDVFEDLMLVPELVAQVSILDQNHNTIAKLGSDQDRILADKEQAGDFTIRKDESRWEQGKFVHPHDGCFDKEGNIYIAEWVATGRVTKLTRA
ncbi:peptidase [Rubripirellula amarantea]|uniref:NHL repeat protein n=1 Tax=Rubripirellula amarantea TaxID=2527999 RepID=A0A5C5WT27_9BACT|nr:hypothetical protein [Rubripirellula amarantea]MDA8744453.1 peptidase [Rubripirellula amarantea]TWT53319.1 NHL repeat protein [Rubripirellula amarantea]